ncbi:cytochrome P450 [Streptomyces sp. NPDC054841]
MRAELHFSPMSPSFVADPYSYYRRLRQEDPVHFEPVINGWLLTRYADVLTLMGDPRLVIPQQFNSTYIRLSDETRKEMQVYADRLEGQMLLANPPRHTRLRQVFSSVLRPGTVEGLRPLITGLAEELLAEMASRSRTDFVNEFAFPLAARVFGAVTGAPEKDSEAIAQLGHDAIAIAGGITYGTNPLAAAQTLNDLTTNGSNYIASLITEHRENPTDDVLSAVIAAGDRDERTTSRELIGSVGLLYTAAVPKIAYYLSNGLLALIRHPDQYAALGEEPALAESAANELLRYDCPVHIAVPQVATAPIELDGHLIQRGQGVHLVLGSANRDPERFTDPEHLDLRRPPIRHLGFGVGLHNCIGASIALIFGQVVFPRIAARFPNLHLEGASAAKAADTPSGLVYRRVANIRALTALPVAL